MTEQTATDVVLVERIDQHITLITLNREAAGNAINAAVAEALEAAVQAAEADPEVWVTVLTGAGQKTFCAGADLKEVAAGRAEKLLTRDGGFAGFVHAQRSKPCIAAVDGVALAGGLEIVLACEMVVASEIAKFGLPEVKRGLVALAGGLYRLPRALPRALAFEMISTGNSIDAATALAYGLVNRVVPSGHVRDAALDLARAICANAPLAVRESLLIARHAHEEREPELKKLGYAAWKRISASEDFKEGPRAFIEKRKPNWSGR